MKVTADVRTYVCVVEHESARVATGGGVVAYIYVCVCVLRVHVCALVHATGDDGVCARRAAGAASR